MQLTDTRDRDGAELSASNAAIEQRLDALSSSLAALEERLTALERSRFDESVRVPGTSEPSEREDPALDDIRKRLAALESVFAELEADLGASQRIPNANPGFIPLGSGDRLTWTQPMSASRSNPEAKNWSAQQAAGEPDTDSAGDQRSAWASQRADGGDEWLEVTFARRRVPSAIVIVESFNPGAVVQVEAVDSHGKYHVVWHGHDPTTEAPADFRIPYHLSFATKRILIKLDTTLVSGWNEIDTVGLDVGGQVEWATSAEASSFFGHQR